LFHRVQVEEVFPDVKTFSDCIPLTDPVEIKKLYDAQKSNPEFSLKSFVDQHFQLPPDNPTKKTSKDKKEFDAHIVALWDHLTRGPDKDSLTSSLIALPHEYVVPGGRFKEIYY